MVLQDFKNRIKSRVKERDSFRAQMGTPIKDHIREGFNIVRKTNVEKRRKRNQAIIDANMKRRGEEADVFTFDHEDYVHAGRPDFQALDMDDL